MADPESTAANGADSRHPLPLLGAAAALLLSLILVAGPVDIVVSSEGLRNWLVVIFEVASGRLSLSSNQLAVINPLDVVVLVLVGLAFLGTWPVLGRRHKVWLSIAVALPFVGLALLLLTDLAGRSAVMGSGIIVAFLMLRPEETRPLAYLGILSNALLLAGDLALTGSSFIVTGVVACGYFFLIAWFAGVALFCWRAST